ncbi:DNA-7-methylguanine glycosylase [Enterococcus saigonensis]|uniref:DNA-7-methylguanine glycosylase n=1 Tax=Enterococcus saigonensis TaxID=1805431 RepID=A0A679IP25_9ENTE|nr:DNA alkylation repair protein [Enterococcus saigonensis]BCA86621.1 DNA-7-methylguanine glycosylase [Enterococcus saigonensis]
MSRLTFISNPKKAVPMANYMRNQFSFLGIPKPQRAEAEKVLLKESRQWSTVKLQEEIFYYYQQNEREYQYVAIDLFNKNVLRLELVELKNYLPLVAAKEWWDSIDSWRKGFNDYVKAYPETLTEVFSWFYQAEDFWFRRISINLQLQSKTATDLLLLEKAILNDRQTNEFFIQKAIGWSLREYSKTDPLYVTEFIAKNNLSRLAVREGSRLLKKASKK